MKPLKSRPWHVIALAAALGAPACATVQITSITPSVKSPQLLGTAITWTVTAVNSQSDLLAFQFNVAVPKLPLSLARDFNIGTYSSGVWTARPFVWVPSGVEGLYRIEVIAKDFTSGESASQTVLYSISPLAAGSSPVVVATANPLVALFGAPSCAAGSSMRVSFQQQSKATSATVTNYQACHPPATMNFEIAGMYPNTTYNMFSQTSAGGVVTNGPTITFTTGSLPTDITFPSYTQLVPPNRHTDTTDSMLLFGPIQFGAGPAYPDVASDLSGNIMWYYNANVMPSILLTRPLADSTMLTIQSGSAWNLLSGVQQLLRQIDLAGNIIKETNTGALQQQLKAMGVSDGGPCTGFPKPAPVGSACLSAFHHDAIQTLPNGQTAVLVSIERIFPAGTQGDTSGLPVDVVGDMILVLDRNWQVAWYFDTFQHDTGPPQLNIERPAVLGETCVAGQTGCPPMFLMGPGIAPLGKDWLHGNSIYYWPQSGDLVWSSRHQDWIMKTDYQNGAGTGDILWRLGPCGDFSFDNLYNDPWPWNSHQHEAGIEKNGAGPLTFFDNGNTRVSPPTGNGSSTGCMPGVGSGNSRGMALTVDETNMRAIPVLSQDLGVFSTAQGSAQLLSNGDYFYVAGTVLVGLSSEDSQSIELLPITGSDKGDQVLNVETTDGYRGWQMPSLYNPPIT
jgi:arylsulfate sulfotransferase